MGIFITFFHIFVLDKCIGAKWLSDGYFIRHPLRWTWYTSAVVMSAVVTGIAASIKRFVFLMVCVACVVCVVCGVWCVVCGVCNVVCGTCVELLNSSD